MEEKRLYYGIAYVGQYSFKYIEKPQVPDFIKCFGNIYKTPRLRILFALLLLLYIVTMCNWSAVCENRIDVQELHCDPSVYSSTNRFHIDLKKLSGRGLIYL